jgi:hypothetical protein
MGIQKVTFESGNVTAKIDADLYHFFYSKDIGILKGLKNECQVTLANNTLTFQDGYVSVYGRIIYIENQTTIGITPDSNKNGYVVLGVNTATNEVSLYLKEQTSGYPSLTLTNLLTTEGLYEFVLCAYTKTTTSVSINQTYSRKVILNDKDKIADLENKLLNRYRPVRKNLTKVSNGVYQFFNTSSVELSESLVYVLINNTTIISFPGDSLFIHVGSNRNISYRYAGADYTLSVVYEQGTVTLSCGNTTHNITSAYLKK